MGTTFNNVLIVQKMNFQQNFVYCFPSTAKRVSSCCVKNKRVYNVISLEIHFLHNQKIIKGGHNKKYPKCFHDKKFKVYKGLAVNNFKIFRLSTFQK